MVEEEGPDWLTRWFDGIEGGASGNRGRRSSATGTGTGTDSAQGRSRRRESTSMSPDTAAALTAAPPPAADPPAVRRRRRAESDGAGSPSRSVFERRELDGYADGLGGGDGGVLY